MPSNTPDSPQFLAEQTYRLLREEAWDEAHDAFDSLHDLLQPQLIGIARRKMRQEEAEDMVEEGLMSLYRQLSKKECPANVEAWTVDVVNKRVADHYRLRRNTAERLAAPAFWEVHASQQEAHGESAQNPLEATLKKEEQQQLNVLLDSLPHDLRSVLEAHYFDELTWDEVGKQLGLTIDVVKKKAKKALSAMKKTAAKRGYKHDK